MYSDGGQGARYQWIVPRRVMCALFWAGVLLLFVGMILLVTSQHRGKVFQSWGAVVLGLGLCILLACIILCIHTYFVMSARRDNQSMNAVESGSKKHARLTNATLATTMLPGAPSDALNGSGMAPLVAPPRLAHPPRYGISVTTTPAPTVRLYVSDVIAEQDDSGRPQQIVIVEPQSSFDQKATFDVNHLVNNCCENESNCGDNATGDTWHQRVPTSLPDRKLSFASGNAVSAQVLFSEKPHAADAWLSQQQITSRTVPLPFPPANITFDALDVTADDDVIANDGAVGGVGISSCDESFSQSTETIIARGNEKPSSKKATTSSRRKSLYHNAVEQSLLGTGGSETARGHQVAPVAPVTLPRHSSSGSSRKPRVDHVNFTSKTISIDSKSRSERRLVDTDNGAKLKVRGQGEDDRMQSSVDADLRSSGTLSKPANQPAKCRVTRINLHSISNSEAAQISPPLSPSVVTNITLPSYSDDIADESPSLPMSARSSRFQTVGGRTDVRFAGDASGGSGAAASSSRDRRISGVIPTTARTCGPACVTVTPLGPHVVAVEQCPRFLPLLRGLTPNAEATTMIR